MKKLWSWISESNRPKHLLYAIPIGLVFTILCVLGVQVEWNSKTGNREANGTGFTNKYSLLF